MDKKDLSLATCKNNNTLSVFVFFCILVSITIISGCQSNKPKPEQKTNAIKTSTPASKTDLANYNKALAELRNNKTKKAEALLLKLSKKRPDLAGPWANLGLIKLKQNKFLEAEKYVKTALEQNPKMPQALNLMGLLAIQNKKIQEAEQHYLSAIKFKRNYAKAHYNLALLYDIYLQDIGKAATHYRLYLRLTKNKDKDVLNWLEQLENSMAGG